MYNIVLIVFSLTLISSGSSEFSQHVCCFPKQFETYLYYNTALLELEYIGTGNGTVKTAYDGVNQRTFAYKDSNFYRPELSTPLPKETDIVDYKKNKQWRVYNDISCNKLDVGLPLYEECIPGNATLLSQGTFGLEGKMLLTYLFHDRIYHDPYEITISVIMSDVTKGECWPVRMTYSQAYVFVSDKSVDITSADIFDFSPGIKDTSIFTPPSMCDHAETKEANDSTTPPPVGLKETIVGFSTHLRNTLRGGNK